MKKLLLLLTLFFTVESSAGESPITDDEWDDFTKTLVVVGGVAFLVAAATQYNSDYGSVDYLYFDEQSNSIIFTEDSGLENFEINFSNQMSQNVFEPNNFFSSDDLYVGLTYRF